MHPIRSQQRRKQSSEHSQLSKTSAPASLSHRCAETWPPRCTCSAQCQPSPVPSTGSTAAHWGRERSASPSCLSAFAGQMRVVLTHPAVYGTSCPTGLSAGRCYPCGNAADPGYPVLHLQLGPIPINSRMHQLRRPCYSAQPQSRGTDGQTPLLHQEETLEMPVLGVTTASWQARLLWEKKEIPCKILRDAFWGSSLLQAVALRGRNRLQHRTLQRRTLPKISSPHGAAVPEPRLCHSWLCKGGIKTLQGCKVSQGASWGCFEVVRR